MKTPIQILLGAAVVACTLPLSACSEADRAAAATAAPVTASEAAALSSPEPGAAPAQYSARLVTLRLLGTQGEGEQASATLADTATWYTRTYRLGETLGRNLKIAAVRDSELLLADGGAAPRMVRAGQDVQVRLVEHEFDAAAVEHGEHQWTVQAAVMRRLLGRYGLGATATPIEFAGRPGIKLGPVQAGSVLARLGLQAGDLLFECAGRPATAASLEALATAVTERQVVIVQMGRGGSLWERAYVVE